MPFIPNPQGTQVAEMYIYDKDSSAWVQYINDDGFSESYTAAGVGASYPMKFKFHTWQVISDASLTAWDVKLQGSIDGVNWFDLDEWSDTANTMRHVAYKPVKFIRFNVVSIGDATTLTVAYCGMR